MHYFSSFTLEFLLYIRHLLQKLLYLYVLSLYSGGFDGGGIVPFYYPPIPPPVPYGQSAFSISTDELCVFFLFANILTMTVLYGGSVRLKLS